MFQRFSFRLLVATAVLTASCVAQSPTVTLHIQVDKPLHPVSPRLYGLMTEEINYSYDGGLYAEMVRNRTFQDHGWAGVAHWNLLHLGNAQRP
jgi:alpha-N-arabinofuranosidase